MKISLNDLKKNLWAGLKVNPLKVSKISWIPFLIYIPVSMAIGFGTGFFQLGVLKADVWRMVMLPLTMIIFPSLLEEAFFRGVLIPRNILIDRGWKGAAFAVVVSTFLFVVWHPVGALTINPGAREIFMDWRFLMITTALGLACGFAYVISRCLWVPVIIHWLTVLIWVFLLGGRNLVVSG